MKQERKQIDWAKADLDRVNRTNATYEDLISDNLEDFKRNMRYHWLEVMEEQRGVALTREEKVLVSIEKANLIMAGKFTGEMLPSDYGQVIDLQEAA
jgi:hypothetical protein